MTWFQNEQINSFTDEQVNSFTAEQQVDMFTKQMKMLDMSL